MPVDKASWKSLVKLGAYHFAYLPQIKTLQIDKPAF